MCPWPKYLYPFDSHSVIKRISVWWPFHASVESTFITRTWFWNFFWNVYVCSSQIQKCLISEAYTETFKQHKNDSLNDLTKFQKCSMADLCCVCVYSEFKSYFVDEKLTWCAKAQVLSNSWKVLIDKLYEWHKKVIILLNLIFSLLI